MMRRLFGDRARPFYGQARAVRLGPLPEDALAEYIGERFARSGRDVGDILDPLLATACGHPQRAMLLAHFLWERTARGEESDEAGWQAALSDVYLELRDEFDSVWSGLADGERRTLAAIARGSGLAMSKSVLDELQLARSTARDARDRLIEEGYVQGEGDELELVDLPMDIALTHGRYRVSQPPVLEVEIEGMPESESLLVRGECSVDPGGVRVVDDIFQEELGDGTRRSAKALTCPEVDDLTEDAQCIGGAISFWIGVPLEMSPLSDFRMPNRLIAENAEEQEVLGALGERIRLPVAARPHASARARCRRPIARRSCLSGACGASWTGWS